MSSTPQPARGERQLRSTLRQAGERGLQTRDAGRAKARASARASTRFAAAVVAALAAVAPVSAVSAQDGAGLTGSWLSIAATQGGAPAPDLLRNLLTFDGEHYAVKSGGDTIFSGSFTADPASDPKSIDFVESQASELRGNWLGIYQLEGANLTICVNSDDQSLPRPADFAACNAAGYVVLTFEPVGS